MRIAPSLLLMALAACTATGCATAPALFDLVVPNPVADLSVDAGGPGGSLRWEAGYGREPEDIGHYPIHVRLNRRGEVEVPAGYERCTTAFVRLASESRGDPDREGTLELRQTHRWLGNRAKGPAYGPPDARSRASAGEDCIIVLAPGEDDLRRLVSYDLDGRVIHEQTLPFDIPVVDPRRWGVLLLAPVADAVFTPASLVVASGYGVFAGVRAIVRWVQ
jgi:hypothetical protein